MFKKFLVILLISIGCTSIYSAPQEPYSVTAECKVTLDTTGIEYFECGFTEEENPQSPINSGGVSTYAIGTGGIKPAGEIILTSSSTPIGLEIKSKEYTIWAFKIGIKNVEVILTANPLANSSVNIPYDVYIHKTSPSTQPSPTISVVNSSVPYTIPTEGMNSFIDFWTTKFMIRVSEIPAGVISGRYQGTLTLLVKSTN